MLWKNISRVEWSNQFPSHNLHGNISNEKRKDGKPGKTHMVKGESGLGFGPVWCCSLGLSSIGDWAMLLIDKLAMLEWLSNSNVGRGDAVGTVGDGDVGGLRSSYLKTKCAHDVQES